MRFRVKQLKSRRSIGSKYCWYLETGEVMKIGRNVIAMTAITVAEEIK